VKLELELYTGKKCKEMPVFERFKTYKCCV